MRTRQVLLTLDDGQHDPPRIGWWKVTGPQPESDVYALIEFAVIHSDKRPPYEGYAWFLYQRTTRHRPFAGTYMREIADGVGRSRDEALEQLANVWTQLIGTA